MADTLTIRNLSSTPLQLTLVERFASDPTAGAAGAPPSKGGRGLLGSVSSFLWGVVRAPWALVSSSGSCVDGTAADVGVADVAAAAAEAAVPLAKNEVVDVTIGPFETRTTDIRPADPTREVLRLTFAASPLGDETTPKPTTDQRDSHPDEPSRSGPVQRYTVAVSGPTPRSIELKPVEISAAATAAATPPPSFAAIYTAHHGHLAILDSSSAPLASWMAGVDGAWPVSCLSLPGTHNSPACYFALPSVRCQAEGVAAQLAHGVRFLDVRVSVSARAQPHADPRLALVHGAFPVSLRGAHYFSEVHRDICAFLDAHPTETVLLSVKREGTGRGTDADLARQLLDGYVRPGSADGPAGQSRWFTEPRIPTLDEVRGRIVLVRRFALPAEDHTSTPGWGLDGSDWPDNVADGAVGQGLMRLQDFYGVMQPATIDKKIRYACAHLERCACQAFAATSAAGIAATAAASVVAAVAIKTPPPPPPPPLFINFLSGSNLFNAGCWPENIAARVNPAIIEHLCVQHAESGGDSGDSEDSAIGSAGDGSTGIVVTDWVGYGGDWDLMRCIIAWNGRLRLKR